MMHKYTYQQLQDHYSKVKDQIKITPWHYIHAQTNFLTKFEIATFKVYEKRPDYDL